MGPLKIPFIPYHIIGEEARIFLEEIGCISFVPVDIEAIVEFDLGLDILPIPGLQKAIGTEAFLSSNLKKVHIDQFILENRPGRYRFSLAHEIGHLRLHADIYAGAEFNNLQEWKNWHDQLSDDDRFWLERHANDFAGHLLVPTAYLRTKFFGIMSEARERIRKCSDMGLPGDETTDTALSWMADKICPDFQVSRTVVEIRLRKEKLLEHL